MYDSNLYQVDIQNRQESYAIIQDGALLYRLASISHWEKHHIISGEGALNPGSIGRYHQGQRVSYCANNIIICISELLYHMYRKVLDGIKANEPTRLLSLKINQRFRLAIFSVEEIANLVYVDSIGAKEYDPTILSSTVVYPDPTYEPLNRISYNLRTGGKSGVVYPSARHSKDLAFAFFNDETSKIKSSFYEAPFVNLRLIVEEQDKTSFPPENFMPHTDKLHATMGYYEFEDPNELDALKTDGLVHPTNIPFSGYVDFVRRHYLNYPRDAFLP